MRRAGHTWRGLVMVLTLVSTVCLTGCSENVEEAIREDVNNRAFTFPTGAVFHQGLANMSTTLSFMNNAANFTLTSATGTATGDTTFGSCTLTIVTSTYAFGAGPQVKDAIRLDPCDFDLSNTTLVVGNGTTTAISAPAVPL
ncbi:MAG: hypothetical protein FJZ47_01725 [Candidatus Tectomicrobia bacterium]|uniref:Lipoprotein n=1 Tax=Tectimicrobiota bacterium TaxID=2528274 RepID=A0A937VX32_UNCTE|nr:hypothetical protein [Candidatus Tectomicrobia bacterium]